MGALQMLHSIRFFGASRSDAAGVRAPVCTENLDSEVMVMKSTEDRI